MIWPETVYPTTFGAPQSEEGAELDARIVSAVDRWKVPLVFGAYEREEGAEFNAAVFLSPGQQPAFYRKAHLFPLTEHVPAALDGARFRGWFPWTGTWTAGNGPRALSLTPASGAPLRVAPLICYDVVHSDGVAAAARLEPDLLVNLSNDSWFGGTVGARVHLAIAAIRSVETRLPQVRSTNSGISAAIDPLGEISGPDSGRRGGGAHRRAPRRAPRADAVHPHRRPARAARGDPLGGARLRARVQTRRRFNTFFPDSISSPVTPATSSRAVFRNASSA